MYNIITRKNNEVFYNFKTFEYMLEDLYVWGTSFNSI